MNHLYDMTTDERKDLLMSRLTVLANTLDGVRTSATLDGVDAARLYDAARTARDVAKGIRSLIPTTQPDPADE